MLDFNGNNRGFCFVTYKTKLESQRALKGINNFEIRKGRLLGACQSVDNCRLFVGGIPKNKKKDEIFEEMQKVTEGVVDVIVYPSAADKTKNRGFSFVEYNDHKAAAMARRKLMPGEHFNIIHVKYFYSQAEFNSGAIKSPWTGPNLKLRLTRV